MTPLPAVRGSLPDTLAQPFSSSLPEDESDRSDIFSRLRRHKLVFCSTFFLALCLIGGFYAVMPRTYQAGASLILTTPEPLLGQTDPVVEEKRGDQADLESQALVLHSLNLLQTVASQAKIVALIKRECEARKLEPLGRLRNILRPSNCNIYVTDKAAAAEYLQGRLGVSADGRSRVIDVAYGSPIAEAARTIPNAVIEAYIAEGLQDQLNSRLAAVDWLRSEIARVSKDLAKTEARIEAFHREHDLMQGETSLLAAEQLTLVDQELARAHAAQSQAAAQLNGLAGDTADAPATLQNRAINDIKQELSHVAGQAAALESIHGSDYPQLIALRQEQSILNARLNMEMSRVAGSLRRIYATATDEVHALEQQLKEAKRTVTAATDAQTEIASLQRHADVQRELYLDLSKKVDALEIDRRVMRGDARVISYAQYPDNLASPRKLSFALGGVLFAFAAAVGATLMLDRGDRTVRSKQSVQRMAGVPVLGHIPALRSSKLTACRQVTTPCALQEAARQLFANCVLMHGTNRPRSILVSSALPKDGKTFVTLALAQFAARSGRRVLAIEADLRRPDFERALSLKATRGLANYLLGEAKFEEVLLPGRVPGLDVIVAGVPTFDSTELISNGRIANLLSWAVDRYDLVFMDGPPTEVLADSYLLAKEVDGVLFCVRWGASDTRIVSQALQQLIRRGAHVFGLVVDRVAPRQLHLYERYKSYGWGYLPRLSQ